MQKLRAVLRWFVSDRDGHVVIGQFPNLPLLIWFAALVLAQVFSGGLSTVLSVTSKGALLVWAAWELVDGDSPFRRVLGLAVLGYQLVAIVFW